MIKLATCFPLSIYELINLFSRKIELKVCLEASPKCHYFKFPTGSSNNVADARTFEFWKHDCHLFS